MMNNENWEKISGSDKASFGTLLRFYRKKAGMSQKELRRRLKERGYPISGGCLSNYETGRRLPDDPRIVVEISECLGFEQEEKYHCRTALLEALLFDKQREFISQFVSLLSENELSD